jgi:hypothetical protein
VNIIFTDLIYSEDDANERLIASSDDDDVD